MTTELPPSPCINICELNDDDLCIGCYRSIEEITDWHQYDGEQKKRVMAFVAEREKRLALIPLDP